MQINNPIPANPKDYPRWHYKQFNELLSEQDYNSKTTEFSHIVSNGVFWQKFLNQYSVFEQEFQLKKSGELFTKSMVDNKIHLKSYESLISKIYRKNVLCNKNCPQEPTERKWIKKDNIFVNIKDILRTTVVVKYIDSIDFLINKFKDICKENNLLFEYNYENRDEGYYAAHCYIQHQIQISGDIVWLEVQITTQFQEILKNLLHKYYEQERELEKPNSCDWKWEFGSNKFSVHYLGHTLHFLEGIITNLRQKGE